MSLLAFLRTPRGNLLLLVLFVMVGGWLIWRTSQKEKPPAIAALPAAPVDPATARESIAREGSPFKLPSFASNRTTESHREPEPASAPSLRGQRSGAAPTKALPISLFTATTETVTVPTKHYAPFGRLIPCETVVALESSRLDTPVIALVTEDVWHQGELIIPAGVEVHGRASVDRSRERIAISGRWVLVWRDDSSLNGTEMVLSGIALERDVDPDSGAFGPQDGSAGLRGTLVKTDDWQEIKLFASTFLSGMASGLQEVRSQGGILSELAQVPKASGRNAALQGTADVLNTYARQIQETIARDGFFVRIPAHKAFYLYVTETIDPGKGSRGNVANAELWKKSP